MTAVIVSALTLGATFVAGRAGVGMLRADGVSAARRLRHEAAAFTTWHGLGVAGVVCVLALLAGAEGITGSGALAFTPMWFAGCLLGVFGATRSHDRVDLVVLVCSALGITGLHARYLFVWFAWDEGYDAHYAPMLVVFWVAAVSVLVATGADARRLARVLPAAFVGLLVLGLVINPAHGMLPFEVRLAVGILLAVPLGVGAGAAPRSTLAAGLLALAGGVLVEAVTGSAPPGYVGAGHVVPVVTALVTIAGMFLLLRHLTGGEETRRIL